MSSDDRARRRAVDDISAIAADGHPAPELYGRLLGVLGRVMDVESACFHLSDPLTGLPVSGGGDGDAPGSLEESLHFEFEREDVSRFSEIQTRTRPVAVLSEETRGRPTDSPRYREMIEPEGGADELRVAFADGYGVWGSLVMFSSSRRYSSRDAALVGRVVPAVAGGLRLGRTEEPQPLAAAEWDGPGVIVVDSEERVEMADERALARMDALGADVKNGLPAAFSVVCAWARLRDPGRPARARSRAGDGRWLTIDVTPLDSATDGRLAIIVQSADGPDVLEAAMRSQGLTAREREIAGLLVAGRSNKEIAAALELSPHTVSDHLKAIFERTGARNRAEVASRALGAHEASVGA
jgi:DNA-binding CsgD family transcriptional regulator